MNDFGCVWVAGEPASVVLRSPKLCVAALESGNIAVVAQAPFHDDPHPWIAKIEGLTLYEPRAGAMRPVLGRPSESRSSESFLTHPESDEHP